MDDSEDCELLKLADAVSAVDLLRLKIFTLVFSYTC